MGGNLQCFRSPQAPARLTLKFACLGSPSGSIGEKPLSKEGDSSNAKPNPLSRASLSSCRSLVIYAE